VSNQQQYLKDHVRYVSEHSPYYKELFRSRNIGPESISSVADLKKIPFTTKEDLQSGREKFIAVPREKLIDHVTTSGTSGKPVTLSLTDKDLDRLAENEMRSFRIAGIKNGDTIQLMTTLDRRFMAGMAYFLGARKLGAGIIRVGNGIPQLQWDTIMEMKPNVVICVPSFLLKLAEWAEQNGTDHRSCSVKKAICIGEAIRTPDFELNTLGKKIQEKWDLQLHSTYASSEMATAFTECEHQCGGHHMEELVIAELIDENGNSVGDGEPGELVITPLGVEGMPLLRFKTGDICIAHHCPCACGRPGMRLSPVLGRKNQMIKYRGTSFYPNALYDILENFSAVKGYQVQVNTGEFGTDEININIGLQGDHNTLNSEITDIFKARLRVVPRLNFVTPEVLEKLLFPGNGRKPLLFVDNRKTEN
jgi:phenylacetate-CoA ligase